MSALLSTLPGDIEGLLRRGSPVVHPRFNRVLIEDPAPLNKADRPFTIDGLLAVSIATDLENGPRSAIKSLVALDLSDPTGRAHAAWWATAHRHIIPRGGILPTWTCDEPIVVRMACENADMTPSQIDTLARLVLRLAGRTS